MTHADLIAKWRALASDEACDRAADAQAGGTLIDPTALECLAHDSIAALEAADAEIAQLKQDMARWDVGAYPRLLKRAERAEAESARLMAELTKALRERDELRHLAISSSDEGTHFNWMDEIDALRAENAKLRNYSGVLPADYEANKKDAERYRWLRTCEHEMWGVEHDRGTGNFEFICLDELDAAIDAAMREKGNG